MVCYTTRRNIVSSHKILARGYTILMEGGETTIWRGRRHIMTCDEENGMPLLYLDDLFNLLNEPEQDQGPFNLEPRLIQTNLSVNIMTGPSIGRLAALRGAQMLNDLSAEDRESNSYNSFESQRSAHDLNSARRDVPIPFRPIDRQGHRNERRDK
jgi:hypothetical protein